MKTSIFKDIRHIEVPVRFLILQIIILFSVAILIVL